MNPGKAFARMIVNLFGGKTAEQAEEERNALIRALQAVLDMSNVKPSQLTRNAKARKRDAVKIKNAADKAAEKARKEMEKQEELADQAGTVAEKTDEILNLLSDVNLNLTTDDFELPKTTTRRRRTNKK